MKRAKEAAATISAALERHFVSRKSSGRGGERSHTWASGWQPCLRAICLDLTHPEDRAIEPEGFARMEFGNVFEVAVRTALEQAGQLSEPRFTVEGQQERFVLKGSAGSGAAAGKVVATGKIDGKLRFEGCRRLFPFECKAGESVKRIMSLDEMLRSPWASRYLYQLLLYLLGTGEPEGLFVLHSGGLPTLLPVVLEEHLDKAEAFYRAAEQAYRVKHAGEPLPDFSGNPEHCRRCDHRGKSCAPPWDSGEGPWISTDPELEALVDTMAKSSEAAAEYARAKKRVAYLCRGKYLVIIGSRTLTGRPWGRGWKTELAGEKGGEE